MSAGMISDMMAFPTNIMSVVSKVMGEVNNILSKSMFMGIIGMIVIIGKCVFAAFNFFIKFFVWIGYLIVWIFFPWPENFLIPKRGDNKVHAGFIPWLIRYIIVVVYKVINLPKCFLWYFLDTAGWILYLPFRFIFWLMDLILGMGIVEKEHKAWDFFDQIDYFLHGRPNEDDNYFITNYEPDPKVDGKKEDPNTLNMGFHIIHFPNSVMFKCYMVDNFTQANLKEPFPMDEFMALMRCAMNPF